MPFGKRFRLGGGGDIAPIGVGDGDPNLDALSGQNNQDFSHLSGGNGKVSLSSSEPTTQSPPAATTGSEELERPQPEESVALSIDAGTTSTFLENMYRLETPEELESGDPEEVINVPMIFTVEKMGIKRLLGKRETERKITFRKMKRGHYRAHYAKDASGNYIGTKKAAFDAGLVYVHTATANDMDAQINAVAFGKEHHGSSFPSAGGTYVPSG